MLKKERKKSKSNLKVDITKGSSASLGCERPKVDKRPDVIFGWWLVDVVFIFYSQPENVIFAFNS